MRTTEYFFVACQPGGEGLVKSEIARLVPGARFAFSRRGFVTFKAGRKIDPSFAIDAVFAREMGASYGRLSDDEIAALAPELAGEGSAPMRVHLSVFGREQPDDPNAAAADERLRSAFPYASGPREDGDVVLDVAVAEGEPPNVGAHVHGPLHSPAPGGWAGITPPAGAPSRAYAKIEEAIAWSGAVLEPGDVALELGSAPGGACYALLERGLIVHGVDPGEMAESVRALGGDRFIHHRMPAGALKKETLPRPVHWFAMDMNLAPRVALRYAERIVVPLRRSLLGAFFTLKMNAPEDAESVPALLRRIEGFGFARVIAKQLPSHRREIGAMAFTEDAIRRGRVSTRRLASATSAPGAGGATSKKPPATARSKRAERP